MSWSDEYKEPATYIQLTGTANDQSEDLPWRHGSYARKSRCIDIYVQGGDARMAWNSSSGSATTFLAAGQRYKYLLPWSSTGTTIHYRNNVANTESKLHVQVYYEFT